MYTCIGIPFTTMIRYFVYVFLQPWSVSCCLYIYIRIAFCSHDSFLVYVYLHWNCIYSWDHCLVHDFPNSQIDTSLKSKGRLLYKVTWRYYVVWQLKASRGHAVTCLCVELVKRATKPNETGRRPLIGNAYKCWPCKWLRVGLLVPSYKCTVWEQSCACFSKQNCSQRPE